MPLSTDQKDNILQNLRFLFNREDEYIVEPNRSREFSKQVQSDVAEIVEHKYHLGINGWGDRCFDVREKSYYLHDHVAELLGVSRKSIQNQEKMNKNIKVDPFYLEAFSLIYRTSPYELLGLPNPHLVCPMTSWDNKELKYSNVIINSLYDETNPDKLAILETLVKVGKLHFVKYQPLIAILTETITFSKIFDSDPLKSHAANDNTWRKTQLPSSVDLALCNSATFRAKRLYCETYLLLEDLQAHNPARLKTLAQLALCDDEALKKLKYFMQEIGYPKDPKSLNMYSIDELIHKPGKKLKDKKRVRRPLSSDMPQSKDQKLNPVKKHDTQQDNDSVTKTLSPQDNKKEEKPMPMPIGEIQKIIYYFPQIAIGESYRNIKTVARNTAAFTGVYGSVEKLTALLQQLSFEKSDDTPEYKAISVGQPKYRIDLLDKVVAGEDGIAQITALQANEIAEYVKMVIKKENPPPESNKPSASGSHNKEK